MHRPTFFRSKLALILLSPLACALAHADNVNVNQTVDLNAFISANNDLHFSDAPRVTIANGDDVTVTFNFSANQRLTLTNSTNAAVSYATGWPWLESWGAAGQFNISNISITLIAPTVFGSGDTSLSLAGQTDGKVHLGPLDYFNLGANSTISFSGITATYHVDSVPGDENVYTPWIHGYLEDVQESITTGKKIEKRSSELQICYNDPFTSEKGYKMLEQRTSERYDRVPEVAPTAVLLLLGTIVLSIFGRTPSALKA